MGHVQNETLPLISEFMQRQRLAKIGFQSDISKLPFWKAEAFNLISSEIDRHQSDDLKRKRK